MQRRIPELCLDEPGCMAEGGLPCRSAAVPGDARARDSPSPTLAETRRGPETQAPQESSQSQRAGAEPGAPAGEPKTLHATTASGTFPRAPAEVAQAGPETPLSRHDGGRPARIQGLVEGIRARLSSCRCPPRSRVAGDAKGLFSRRELPAPTPQALASDRVMSA